MLCETSDEWIICIVNTRLFIIKKRATRHGSFTVALYIYYCRDCYDKIILLPLRGLNLSIQLGDPGDTRSRPDVFFLNMRFEIY